MRIRNFSLEETEVVDSVADGEYLWLALEEPVLQKVSIYDPTQVLFEFSLAPTYGIVTKISKLKIFGSYIYCLVEGTSQTYRDGIDYATTQPMVVRFTRATPATASSQWSYWLDTDSVTYPTAPTELPIDLTILSTSDIRVLFPGEASGSTAQIFNFNPDYDNHADISLSGLSAVRNITDDTTNMWVATYEQPSTLARVSTAGAVSTWTIKEG